MKQSTRISRRTLLRGGALVLGASLIDLEPLQANTAGLVKTPQLTATEIAAIEEALGKKGTYKEAEATHNTGLPRNDLQITLKGEPVPVPFGFGGWVAIKKTLDGKTAVLMSDCVLLEEEVNSLISAAHANGLEISAIHNHFFYENNRIFYMHVHGIGSPGELAKKYMNTIRASKLAPKNQPASPVPGRTGKEIFDMASLNAIVKQEAAVNGPILKYIVGRNDLAVTAMGAEMTASIGLNSWASFTGTMEKAHIAGDIAMLESEVNTVIKSLRSSNIDVVALHNHMLGEEPRIIFLHYLGTGQALKLAKGFKAVLDQLGRSGDMKMNH